MNAALTIPFLFSIITFQGLQDFDAELSKAREEITKAETVVAAAEWRLVSVYKEFENFIVNIKNAPPPAAGASLTDTMADAAQKVIIHVRGEIAAGRLSSAPGQRQQVAQELKQQISKSLESTLPAGVRAAAAARLGNNLYNITISQSEPRDAIVKLAGEIATKWLDASVPVHELWNRDLFKEVPEAKEYADARTALASANDKLARLEHPERFHPAYANTPEGMVFVMGGVYTLGPNEGYDIDTKKRKTAFQITLKPFYMDKTEVTNKQYADFLKTLPRAEAITRTPETFVKPKDGLFKIPDGRENHPVTGVNYEDAAAYASWARKRIPTEDEWEAAARGYKGHYYPYGGSYESKRANDANSEAGGTAPVATFTGDVSPYGALDMSGNVMEWTSTLEGGKQAANKLESNVGVVIRGGAFDREPKQCSGVYRWIWTGTTKVGNLGFRCVRDAF
ncbi:MAG: formylglycine-generating enzyme family protein [Planctomycetota bacterium]